MGNSKRLDALVSGLFSAAMLLAVLAGTISTDTAHAADRSRYTVRSLTNGAAAVSVQGTSFDARGTLGQPQAIGTCNDSEGFAYLGFWKGHTLVPTGIGTIPAQISAKLHQNFPNPFNPTTLIRYSVAGAGLVEIGIFNVAGQRIRSLVNELKSPGQYVVSWNGLTDGGTKAASGMYFYRLRTGSFTDVRKMVLIR